MSAQSSRNYSSWSANSRTQARVATLVTILAVASAVAWGQGLYRDLNRPLYPVRGVLKCPGASTEGALVTLHGLSPDSGLSSWAAIEGRVDERGEFEVKTRSLVSGAPAGEYAVTVEWRPLVVAGEEYEPGPNLLPRRYADPATTPLRARVQPGLNNLPAILVSRCESVLLVER